MKGSLYALAYAAVLGAVCALLLTAAASFTKPFQEANAKAEEVLNTLLALKVPLSDKPSSGELVEIYDKNVREEKRGDVETYVYYSSPEADAKPQAIATRFSGPGLWGPVKGFLALEPDMKTIRGITFYEHEETPGLGGEIVSSWFRAQFVGRSIVDEDGNPSITISSAGEPAANKVDSITGATMTCDKVQAMLNAAIRDILKETE